ncbi:MAG: TRAP transporter permease [Pseudomonadota bacterium]
MKRAAGEGNGTRGAALVQGLCGKWEGLGYAIAAATGVYYTYVAIVGITAPQLDRSLFIFVGVALVACLMPLGRTPLLRALDLLMLLVATVATVNFNLKYEEYLINAGLPIGAFDTALGLLMMVVCIEASRRALGSAIPIITVIFLLYLAYGWVFPEPLRHRGFAWSTIASHMYASTEGLYGTITYIFASQLFLFLVFGQFLIRCGASDFFNNLCLSMIGTRPGGAAKVAVLSSFIVGSITGSAAANVAITGVISIPLMKKTGYPAYIAAATEAAASTGGTVLPPVMGVAAFIMVAITGIPYWTIAVYSTVPALLYFLVVYIQIHFYALRHGLVGLPRNECPRFADVVRTGWVFLVPVASVFVFVYIDFSLARTALLAIVACVLANWVGGSPEGRMGPRKILDSLAEGTKGGLSIITVAGPVALMSEAILMPGTGLKITGLLIDIGGGSLAATIAIIFVIAYVLGMGLSVVPAYIILATLAAPALIRLDVPVLAAHLVVMWWGQCSNVTPPVALATYVAASIANSPLWKTGWASVIKAAGMFYLPLLFIYQPPLLFDGTLVEIVLTITSIAFGSIVVSAGLEGWLGGRLWPAERWFAGLLGSVLILTQDAPVIAVDLALSAALYWYTRRRRQAEAVPR